MAVIQEGEAAVIQERSQLHRRGRGGIYTGGDRWHLYRKQIGGSYTGGRGGSYTEERGGSYTGGGEVSVIQEEERLQLYRRER